jgi:photosystem II stability/assembly factor-like uncharacterized protein
MRRVLLCLGLAVLLVTGCNDSTGPSSQSVYGWITGGPADGYGIILRTTDGQNWVRQGSSSSIPESNINAVSVVDSLTVWVTGEFADGYGVVLRTTDGGSSWTRVGDASSIPGGALGVVAASADVAWVVGTGNMVMQTINGGMTWTDRSDPSFSEYRWNGIAISSLTDIWICGDIESSQQGLIIHSTNGGNTWLAGGGSILDGWPPITIAAWDSENAWAVGHGFTIVRTTDGGVDWTIVTPDSLQQSFNDANGICLLSPDDAWAVLDDGGIWRTADGGSTWDYQTSNAGGYYLLRISATDTNTAWVSGYALSGSNQGIILYTSDGGDHWTRLDDGSFQGLWAVGMEGAVP